jgi:hypothetical protein
VNKKSNKISFKCKKCLSLKKNIRMNKNVTLLENAETHLTPILPTFKKIYDLSLSKMNYILSLSDETFSKRTKATMFHNIIMNKAKEILPETNIKVVEKYESLVLTIGNTFIARFKKLNDSGFPSNIKTKRNTNIICQQYSLFQDIQNSTFVDIGYQINSTWTEFTSLRILCRNKNEINFILPFNLLEDNNYELSFKEVVEPIELTKRVKVKTMKEETKSA